MKIWKKIIYWAVVLICASATLGILSILIKDWTSVSAYRKVIKVLALIGWVYITYSALTLKYEWLRKLVGEDKE